jgi:transposase
VDNCGIDLHKKESQIEIRSSDTGEITERRIPTSRTAFAKLFGQRARTKMVIESSTESEWVARCLEELGHEVIVADPNFAPMYAYRNRKVKTDRRDANALCEILWVTRQRLLEGKRVQGVRCIRWPTEAEAADRQLTEQAQILERAGHAVAGNAAGA